MNNFLNHIFSLIAVITAPLLFFVLLNNDINNINGLVKRKITKCDNQKQLAELLNISPEDLSNRKRRGTLTKLIEIEAYKRNINFDWIKTGEGDVIETGTHESQTGHVAESVESYNAKPQPKISDLLHKTAMILESPTVFSTALKSNIEAFHYAMDCEDMLAEAKQMQQESNKRIARLEADVTELKKGLSEGCSDTKNCPSGKEKAM